MSELFPLSQVQRDSPRRLWMKKHDLHTARSETWVKDGVENGPWYCRKKNLRNFASDRAFGFGVTEHDAIVDWATRNGVRLWNEEGFGK